MGHFLKKTEVGLQPDYNELLYVIIYRLQYVNDVVVVAVMSSTRGGD